MTWWERLRAIVTREAADVRRAARDLGRKVDDELTRREQELAATPDERVEMIKDQITAEDQRFSELEAEVAGRVAGTAGELPERTIDRVQLLEAEDVSDSPRIRDAIAMVHVSASDDEAFDFEVAVDMSSDVGPDPIPDIARVLAEHPLVRRAERTPHGTIEVTSATLHREDVRLVAAAVVAALLPGD